MKSSMLCSNFLYDGENVIIEPIASLVPLLNLSKIKNTDTMWQNSNFISQFIREIANAENILYLKSLVKMIAA